MQTKCDTHYWHGSGNLLRYCIKQCSRISDLLHMLPKQGIHLYLHPVCSKQSSPPDAAHAGLYTHVLAVLIAAPLAPCVIGHWAGSVSLRLLHGLEGFAPCKCPALVFEVSEAPPDAAFR